MPLHNAAAKLADWEEALEDSDLFPIADLLTSSEARAEDRQLLLNQLFEIGIRNGAELVERKTEVMALLRDKLSEVLWPEAKPMEPAPGAKKAPVIPLHPEEKLPAYLQDIVDRAESRPVGGVNVHNVTEILERYGENAVVKEVLKRSAAEQLAVLEFMKMLHVRDLPEAVGKTFEKQMMGALTTLLTKVRTSGGDKRAILTPSGMGTRT